MKDAEGLLFELMGKNYSFGEGALEKIGQYTTSLGKNIVVISGLTAKKTGLLDRLLKLIESKGVHVVDVLVGSRQNSPSADVYRLSYQLLRLNWDGVVAIGGGSCLDSAKAALSLVVCGGVIEDYFGVGKVSEKSTGKQIPLIAVQTASSSASHLTKYANVTDTVTHQKKVIIDDAIVPKAAIFQYDVTKTMPESLTRDGGLDGVSHCWEVWMGSSGKSNFNKVSEIAYQGIKLIVENLPNAVRDGDNLETRYSLGLGTDLGGYALMVGGTNGGHLGSFSLVDALSHGRACAILNPYYTILFSDAIQDQLMQVAEIYRKSGFITEKIENYDGRPLAEIVAKAMMKFSQKIGFPISLAEANVSENHIKKMLQAAKDPQLKMKLQGMPIPMDAEKGDIEQLMKPTLYAAFKGEIQKIPSPQADR